MNRQLDIFATAGTWLRLLGEACTELVKHHATERYARDLRVWAWDPDPRGIDGLVPESAHASAACSEARDRARDLVGVENNSTGALEASLQQTFGSAESDRPLLVLATLTSGTFRVVLELLRVYRSRRPVLLLALADFPQGGRSGGSLPHREQDGRDALRQAVSSNDALSAVILSRGAFAKDREMMNDTEKQLFMSCIRHLLWLVLSHDKPERLITDWHGTIAQDRYADWTLGHVQFDCGRPNGTANPVRGHTWLGGDSPTTWQQDTATIRVVGTNHLGFQQHAGQTQAVATHVFRDSDASPSVSVADATTTDHDTWLVERIDVVLLNKVSCDHSAPEDSGDASAD